MNVSTVGGAPHSQSVVRRRASRCFTNFLLDTGSDHTRYCACNMAALRCFRQDVCRPATCGTVNRCLFYICSEPRAWWSHDATVHFATMVKVYQHHQGGANVLQLAHERHALVALQAPHRCRVEESMRRDSTYCTQGRVPLSSCMRSMRLVLHSYLKMLAHASSSADKTILFTAAHQLAVLLVRAACRGP